MSLTDSCVQHSLSCGELAVRSEAMTVLCSQLLPHLCADDAFLASQDSFTTKVLCVCAREYATEASSPSCMAD